MDASDEAVFRAVMTLSRPVTAGELTALTGLPGARLEPALRRVVRRFQCVLRVTASGEILYDFGAGLRQRLTRGERFRDRLAVAADRAGRLAARIFKLALVAMLATYGAFYLIVAAAFLGRGTASPSAGQAARSLIRALGAMVRGALTGRGTTAQLLAWTSGDSLAPDDLRRRVRALPLADRVFAFLLGPGRGPAGRAARDRAFLAWATAQRGLVGASDWVVLFGTPLALAAPEAARAYAEFGADVRVSGDGSVVYDYRRMLPAGDPAASGMPAPPAPMAVRGILDHAVTCWNGAGAATLGLAAACLAGAVGFGWVLDQSPEWTSSVATRTLTVWLPAGFAATVLAAAAWTQGRAALAWTRLRRALAAPTDPEVAREQSDLAGLRAREGGPLDFGPEVYSSGQESTPAKIKT